EFALELGDGGVIQVTLPVEGRRAVVGEHLVGVLGLDALGEVAGHLQVRGGGLHPEQVGVRGVGQTTGDTGVDAVTEAVEAFGRTLTGDVGLVALVDVVGDQGRGLRIGACDDQGRDVGHVRGQTCGVQRLDVLAGGVEDLATQVPTLLHGGQLVLPVHPGGTGTDHALHQLVGAENTTETGLGVGDDRGQPVGGVVITLGPGDLVGAQERVVDPTHHGRNRVGRVEALVRVGVAGKVGVGGHLPAGEVDRLQPGADLLDRLVTGERTERVDVVLVVEQVPEALRAAAGQGVLFGDRTAQLDHVVGGI